jgi:hypothetical protein
LIPANAPLAKEVNCMKQFVKRSLVFGAVGIKALLSAAPVYAADDISVTTTSSGSPALGIAAAICGLLIGLVGLALYIWVAVWIWRDASKRNAPGALWVILWLLFSWVALIVYLVVRPKEFVAPIGTVTPPPPPPVEPGLK